MASFTNLSCGTGQSKTAKSVIVWQIVVHHKLKSSCRSCRCIYMMLICSTLLQQTFTIFFLTLLQQWFIIFHTLATNIDKIKLSQVLMERDRMMFRGTRFCFFHNKHVVNIENILLYPNLLVNLVIIRWQIFKVFLHKIHQHHPDFWYGLNCLVLVVWW